MCAAVSAARSIYLPLVLLPAVGKRVARLVGAQTTGPQFSELMVLNVTALMAVSLSVAYEVIRPYPSGPIVAPLLIAIDWLVLRKLAHSHPPAAARPRSVHLLVLPVLCSLMGIVILIAFVRNPA